MKKFFLILGVAGLFALGSYHVGISIGGNNAFGDFGLNKTETLAQDETEIKYYEKQTISYVRTGVYCLYGYLFEYDEFEVQCETLIERGIPCPGEKYLDYIDYYTGLQCELFNYEPWIT